MDAANVAMCPLDITVEPKTGTDVNQKPAYGTAVPYKARSEASNRLVKTADNKTIATTGRLIVVPNLDTTRVPSTEDRLTLPTVFPVLQPPIAAVLPQFDEAGNLDHFEILF